MQTKITVAIIINGTVTSRSSTIIENKKELPGPYQKLQI